MSRDLIKRLRRVAASTLVVLTAGVSLGPVLHGGAGHDTDCDPVIVVHDPSQHVFGSTEPQTRGSLPSHDHCVTCHLFRISRLSQDASPTHACDQPSRALAEPGENFRLSDPVSIPLPARAPPA